MLSAADLTIADQSQAIAEFRTLVDDLHGAGLRVQVRHGHGASLLVFIRVPRDHLGHMVHQSRLVVYDRNGWTLLSCCRIKDWLFGIRHTLPEGDENTTAAAETPAEEIRSVYHAVTWQKELGGAGITPNFGKWKNVTASFPLHDQDACSQLLRELSRKTVLTTEDLDTIRALFGEKVELLGSTGGMVLTGLCRLLSTTALSIATRFSSWYRPQWVYLDGCISDPTR